MGELARFNGLFVAAGRAPRARDVACRGVVGDRMGCGASVKLTTEEQLKEAERARKRHAKRVAASELLRLRMVEPKPGGYLEAHVLDTILTLAGKAAAKLGLLELDGELLKIEYR